MRDKGVHKENAARIANADGHETAPRRGGAPAYEAWTVDDLDERAQEIGIQP